MNAPLAARLRKSHPAFFTGDLPEVTCGDGWFEVLDALFAALTPLLAATAGLSNPPRLYKVSARHGRLKVLLRPLTPEMAALVHRAEAQAARQCERCGAEHGSAAGCRTAFEPPR